MQNYGLRNDGSQQMSLRKILVVAYALLMVVVAIGFIRPLFMGKATGSKELDTDNLVESAASVFQPSDDSND